MQGYPCTTTEKKPWNPQWVPRLFPYRRAHLREGEHLRHHATNIAFSLKKEVYRSKERGQTDGKCTQSLRKEGMLSIQSSNSTSRAMMVPSLSQRMLPPTFRIPSFRTSGEDIPFESQTIRPGRGLVFRRLRRLLSRSSRTTKSKLSRYSGNSCRRASAFRPIWK